MVHYRFRLCAVCCLALLTLLAGPTCFAQPTLSELRDDYTRQLDACKSLDVRYQVFATITAEGAALLPQHSGAAEGVATYRWIRQGDRWLFQLEPSRLIGSVAPVATFQSFDGQAAYTINYEPSDPSIVNAVHVTLGGDARPRSASELRWLLGETMSGYPHTSLMELLGEHDDLSLKEELVDGFPCWKIDLGETQFDGGKVVTTQVWFDAAAGCLPRQIVTRRQAPPNPDVPGGGITDMTTTFKVVEFMQAADGGTWFPRQGEISGNLGSQTIVVDSVSFSPGLPRSAFIPPMPEGTRVRERDANGRFRRYIVGGGPSVNQAVRDLAGEVRAAAQAPPAAVIGNLPSSVDARPPSPYRWSWIIMGVSLLAVAAAIILKCRS